MTQIEEDLTGDDLKQYGVDIEEMNLIIISIPNDIYNYVDACQNGRDIWNRVKRLIQGTELSEADRESCFVNEFDKFTAEPGESLSSVHNLFSQLINDMDRNKIKPFDITINTKFLNCLQTEWYKYVTNIRLAKDLKKDTYDMLFDHLQQCEKLVNASRAKRATKTHDPLALVANTHIRYEICDDQEDSLTTAMMLLARAITQAILHQQTTAFAPPQTQGIKQLCKLIELRLGMEMYKELYELLHQKMPYMFSATTAMLKNYEVEVIFSDEQNNFLLADAAQMEELEELSTNICMMIGIQKTYSDSDDGPSYDSAFISEVQTPLTSFMNPLFSQSDHEQKYLDDIIFDDQNVEVNDGKVEHDKNAHDAQDNALKLLARNAYKEAQKQLLLAKKVKQQNVELTKQLEQYKQTAISENPKLYDASYLHSLNVRANARDTEEILEDYLHAVFKIIQKEFLEDVQVKMNVFDSMKSDIDETLKQNEILKYRLLEATLTHDVERCVFMCFDSKNDNLNDDIEKVKRESH
ncbi:hypothetical protein Tco_0768993 [Tanacetum coccineum]|uniref:Uncharacterized protein n=1 Tax=Tanacetum coccineum TaxID=301880 RepID=A0ABQ4Z922_9ASTR